MAGGVRRRTVLAALTAIGTIAFAAPAGSMGGGGQQPFLGCEYDAADHSLTVVGRSVEARIKRQRGGDEIIVLAKRAGRITCLGDRPTVTNVDEVNVDSDEEVGLDLANGRFGPGQANEGSSSEIEFRMEFAQKGGLRIFGSRRRDTIAIGDVKDGRHGVNLNPREPQRDADVLVRGGFNAVSVLARRGNDRIKATGSGEFAGPLKARLAVSGGTGRDRLTGSDQRDLIGGGNGPDLIKPKGGRDRVRAQGAADTLRLRDDQVDFVQCGPGDDKVRADEFDKLNGCDRSRGS